MRTRIFSTAIAVLLLTTGMSARGEETGPIPEPIEATKTFMRGVLDNERPKLEAAFDFEFALSDINTKFEAMGAGKPYDLQQITDTLIFHFTDKEQQKMMSELDRPDVTFQVRFDEKKEKALVNLIKPVARTDDAFKKETLVGVAKVGDRWKVQIFPKFYPLDGWKISTGTPER